MTKRLLAFLLFGNLYCLAAVQAGMQWDVRTTGSDNNGGGFDPTVSAPGTDYSQQNSPQVAFTDLVVGSTTTQLTSAAHPFSAAYPGNTINITGGSGCTTGHYEILSVSGTTATMDRSLGSSASTCTGNLGGSLQTLTAFVLNNPSFPAGNTVHVQVGTYTLATNQELLPGPFTLRGYAVTHNDYAGRPTLTTGTNSPTQMLGCGASWVQSNNVFDNVNFSSAASSPGYGIAGNGGSCYGVTIMNAKFSGFSTAISGDSSAGTNYINSLILFNVEFSGMTAAVDNDGGVVMRGCYLHGQTSYGVRVGTGAPAGATVLNITETVISGAGTYGIYMPRVLQLILNHVTIADSGSDGVNYPSGQTVGGNSDNYTSISNSLFYGNGGYGVNLASGSVMTGNFFNAYGGNTSGARNNFSAGYGDVTLSASPFNNPSGGDFSLNNTSGGGAALQSAAFPGAMSGGTMTGYSDIGAIQHESSSVAIGGGGYVQ